MAKCHGPLARSGKTRRRTPKVEKSEVTVKPKRGRAKMAKRVKKLDNPTCDCDFGECTGNSCLLRPKKICKKFTNF